MSAGTFLLALLGLASLTYLMRLLGVRLGMASRAKADGAEGDNSPVRLWMDRATVVLISGVAAVSWFFSGHEVADWPRLIGVGLGVTAVILRVPMLFCVLLAMVVTAGLRFFGVFA